MIKLRTQKEEEVLRQARRYARLVCFQTQIENDLVVKLNKHDADSQAEYELIRLGRLAKDLILAMSIDEVEGKLQD